MLSILFQGTQAKGRREKYEKEESRSMAKDKKARQASEKAKDEAVQDEAVKEENAANEAAKDEAVKDEAVQDAAAPQEDAAAKALREAEDKFLRLCAEYDNYRKRTAREKERAWLDSKLQTVAEFLPVYDNLERAMKQQTADSAYAKGVEMTMKGLQDVLTKLGVEVIPALGERFDPNRHNAVMHVDDEAAEENTIVEVFQQGFMCGDKVIRFSMVKVAN